jgi:hypothetical protein
VSNLADVIELYLYDLDVSDELFRRFVVEAIEKDAEKLHGIAVASRLHRLFVSAGYLPERCSTWQRGVQCDGERVEGSRNCAYHDGGRRFQSAGYSVKV